MSKLKEISEIVQRYANSYAGNDSQAINYIDDLLSNHRNSRIYKDACKQFEQWYEQGEQHGR